MGKLPYIAFYPSDWQNEPGLRIGGHELKGVWIDILCLMHWCEERGVLATAGRAWSDEEIARAVGGDQNRTLQCLQQLVALGIANRTQSGALMCRRMVADESKRRKCSEAGKSGGGNPTFGGRSKGRRKGQPKGATKGNLEDEIENESAVSSGYPSDFEVWWKAYPRKEAKGAALKAYQAALKRIDPGKLLDVTKLFAASPKASGEFVPHPATWLNQSRFEDDPAAWNNAGGKRVTGAGVTYDPNAELGRF